MSVIVQPTCSFIACRKPLCWSSNPFLSVGLHMQRLHHRQGGDFRLLGQGHAQQTRKLARKINLWTEIVLRKATSSSVGNFFSWTPHEPITDGRAR
jgi:hypothetical protein